MMLTQRRAAILGMVVNEYITTASPVSSRSLVGRGRFNVSPATIRNELARLEEDGYVTHPHTSAGRVPSDRGYRLYVESLMREEQIDTEEQRTVEHQFHQAAGGLDEWLGLAASVLAATVDNLAVVTRPRSRVGRLKHVQLVRLNEDAALVVAVMDDGRVQQRIVQLSAPATQRQLSRSAERLNGLFADSDAAAARKAAGALEDRDEALMADAIADLIEDQRAVEGTHLDGMRAVLAQPEFASVDRMLDAVHHLGAYEVQRMLPSAVELESGATRVMIGRENGDSWMQDWSVVVSTYGGRDGAVGTVAVLGPTRMPYASTIPRVRYLASLMSELLIEVGA